MDNKSLYYIDEPTCISFSGGRTSAYMLYKTLQAHDGVLPDFAKVVFANTGKEMPETLDFVRDCQEKWGVDIIWLERFARLSREDEPNKFAYDTKVVNYETASRKGEPFEALLNTMGYTPSPLMRFCTAQLKIEAISEYLTKECGFQTPYLSFIGIRGDEPRRAAKMKGNLRQGTERYCPLYLDDVTAMEVSEFWKNNDFDLNLPNDNGVNNLGNCDLCFLKGAKIRQSIIRERPELADWWIEQEDKLSKAKGEPVVFDNKTPSYKTMKSLALDQSSIFDDMFDTETIPCFCGDYHEY